MFEFVMFFINYVCGFVVIMLMLWMMYVFVCDGGLLVLKLLCSVNLMYWMFGFVIWICVVFVIVVMLYGDVFLVLSVGSVVFLFILYVMLIGFGMLVEGCLWIDKGLF